MKTKRQRQPTVKPRAADIRTPRGKKPFRMATVISRVRETVEDFPKAALFELAAEGFDSPFQLLAACVISIRTRDEVTLPTARRLFAAAQTAKAAAKLKVGDIDRLIGACSFHEAKAAQIHKIASRAVKEFGGQLPCDEQVLLSLRGVGPKCASLVLGIACNEPRIGVDVHVHRVVNRWGYVQAATPEKTMAALIEKLPKRYWIELNSLLVPFGKRICTGQAPRCSPCPVLAWCAQVGVTRQQ
jgi:endonuclease-3